MTYDPKSYWTTLGETYKEHLESRRRGKTARNYDAQERMLPALIASLDPHSVLEVGCGYGRMTALVSQIKSIERYDAVDLSARNIELAKGTIKGVEFRVGDFEELEFNQTYDLVFACEVLMHIPPSKVQDFLGKMRKLSRRYVVSLDYCEGRERKLEFHNFNHHYHELYGRFSPLSLTETRIKSERLLGTEVFPQSIFVAEFAD